MHRSRFDQKLLLTSESIALDLVFNDIIAPKIYENIQVKVTKNDSNMIKVEDFMKLIKSRRIVENIKIRPRYKKSLLNQEVKVLSSFNMLSDEQALPKISISSYDHAP